MKETFRNICKSILLFFSFLFALLRGERSRPAILMYHSFDSEGWRYGVSPEQLNRHIAYLTEYKKIVPFKDMLLFASDKKEVATNAVTITVDDGYEDTYSVFFPLAKKYNLPFTLFLTTDLIEKPNLGNLPRPTWKQIKDMYASGLMEIGLHGHTHMHFTEALNRGDEVLKQEIEDSIALIERNLGVKPVVAAYPSGQYNEKVIEYLQSTKCIKAAVATHSGFIRKGDNLFRLRRVEVSRNINFTMFRLRLSPALETYNRLVRIFK